MRNLLFIAALFFGVGEANAQTITNYTTADGLLHDNVNCLDVDAAGSVWFGTQDGVSVFDGTNWTSHTTTTDAGLADNTIQALFVAQSGDVWIGTDFGASIYDGSSWQTYTAADGLGNDQIKCITEDADGHIWFGTNNGAAEFTGSTWTSFGTSDGLPFGGVNEIDVHSDGKVWMGTGLSGVRIYDGTSFSEITSAADGLVDDRIRAMTFDQSDNKWIATSEGITVLNNSNAFVTNYTTIFSLPPPDTLNPIEDIEMDSQGIMWVGVYVDYLVTEGGVCAYNGVNWIQYEVADGLVGPVVRALAVDGNDDVWVATSTGVSKISDPTVSTSEVAKEQFQMYPNPATSEVFIRLDDTDADESITVLDASMKSVELNLVSIGNGYRMNLDLLSPGIYFVQIGTQTKKLIVR